jgi:multisubunit Na+/H+ antiporter MnhB subunit
MNSDPRHFGRKAPVGRRHPRQEQILARRVAIGAFLLGTVCLTVLAFAATAGGAIVAGIVAAASFTLCALAALEA